MVGDEPEWSFIAGGIALNQFSGAAWRLRQRSGSKDHKNIGDAAWLVGAEEVIDSSFRIKNEIRTGDF